MVEDEDRDWNDWNMYGEKMLPTLYWQYSKKGKKGVLPNHF